MKTFSIVDNISLLEVDPILIYLEDKWLRISVLQGLGLLAPIHTIWHPNQGTASKMILFDNAYLELCWIEDKEAAQKYALQTGIDILTRTHWQQTGASPFSVSLRCHQSDQIVVQPCTRQSWTESMRSDTLISFSAENLVSMVEPMCFLIPELLALTNWLDLSSEAHQLLVAHPLGVKKLTDVKIVVTCDQELSDTLCYLSNNEIIRVERGLSPLLEVTFDSCFNGKVLDARPALPFLLRY